MIGVVIPMWVGRVRYGWMAVVAAAVPQFGALVLAALLALPLEAPLELLDELLPQAAIASESPTTVNAAIETRNSFEDKAPSPLVLLALLAQRLSDL